MTSLKKVCGLGGVTLDGSKAKMKIQDDTTKTIQGEVCGIRWGDALSAWLFILVLESTLRNIGICKVISALKCVK